MKPPAIRDYPKSLKVGDETYAIKFVRKFKDSETVGECDPESRTIFLKLGEGREETFKTLIHELMHALLEFEGDLDVKHRFIYKAESLIYQFLCDNF